MDALYWRGEFQATPLARKIQAGDSWIRRVSTFEAASIPFDYRSVATPITSVEKPIQTKLRYTGDAQGGANAFAE
jgi:hypothetical protein